MAAAYFVVLQVVVSQVDHRVRFAEHHKVRSIAKRDQVVERPVSDFVDHRVNDSRVVKVQNEHGVDAGDGVQDPVRLLQLQQVET